MAKRVLLTVLLLVTAACGGSDVPPSSDRACPQGDPADMMEITRQRAELLVGYLEADAERCASELGWAYRVGMRDGESFPVTMDFSLSRVTVTIEEDVVTAIAVG